MGSCGLLSVAFCPCGLLSGSQRNLYKKDVSHFDASSCCVPWCKTHWTCKFLAQKDLYRFSVQVSWECVRGVRPISSSFLILSVLIVSSVQSSVDVQFWPNIYRPILNWLVWLWLLATQFSLAFWLSTTSTQTVHSSKWKSHIQERPLVIFVNFGCAILRQQCCNICSYGIYVDLFLSIVITRNVFCER